MDTQANSRVVIGCPTGTPGCAGWNSDEEGLTPLERALISRIERSGESMVSEVKALRYTVAPLMIGLWLLTVFALSAIVDMSGGDSTQSADVAINMFKGAREVSQ